MSWANIVGSGWIAGVVAFLACAGCSSLPPSPFSERSALNLDSADRIQIGATIGDEIQSMFGAPTIKLRDESSGANAWLYCDREKCSQPRLTVYIDPTTNKVSAVSVTLQDGDPEQDLMKLRARYPGSEPKLQRYLYSYRDYFETVESFVDSKRGISIGYDSKRNRASSVSRSVPPLKEPSLAQNPNRFPKISKLPDREIATKQ